MNAKAHEIKGKPFINWQSTNDPVGDLVVSMKDIPPYQYGVCTWKIVSGKLVERSAAEMQQYQLEYIKESAVVNFETKIDLLNKSTFEFNRQFFHMHEAARELYRQIEKYSLELELITATGEKYLLIRADVAKFMNTFDVALQNIVK